VASALRKRAAEYLDVAISRGFDAPAILHTRGSLAIDDNQNNAAAFFLNLAIQKMEYVRRMSPDVPVSDAIDVALTYNQLGSALFNANRLQDAQAAFERGLALSPKNHALRTNLGSFYRHIKRNDLARRVMQQGIDDGAPAALLNNLGLLELDEGNFSAAITLLEQAAAQLTRISGASAIAEMRAPDGGDVVALIQNNIARARQGMINQAK
jgi:tetratricopeptide (TPR) repeat protein